jgi:hypothetical protein
MSKVNIENGWMNQKGVSSNKIDGKKFGFVIDKNVSTVFTAHGFCINNIRVSDEMFIRN